ncbi:MAG: Hsp20/alpha crystallin family protein [Candidatus Borkfalkiaceae bacterium]|nr:Hsp20/alpha crystallin family protein [Christensenellaceae bacterium]
MKNYPVNSNNERDLLDEMFGGFFKPMFYEDRVNTMATDIKETPEGYEMDVEMPGYKKEDISIDFEKGYLTVSAKSEVKQGDGSDEKENKRRYVRQERRFACRRSYYIGEVDESKITAKYDNGVLMVKLPKKEPPKQITHKITIE